jgi:glycosyltransferase involved in cell wall biosynthesis
LKLAVVMLTSGSVSGGAAKYLRIMLPALANAEEVSDLRVFVPETRITDVGGDGWTVESWPSADFLTGRRHLKRKIREFGADVVFIPTSRWFRTPAPTVIMVRNMEPLVHPLNGNAPMDAMKNVARGAVTHLACRRADRVIAVSAHVRDFLLSRWSLDPSKIATVYHGVETHEASRRPALLSQLQEKFVFTAGSIRPARGLTDVIEAFAGGVATSLHLVIGGQADRATERYKARLDSEIRHRGLEKRVHWLGRLDADEMTWCFRNAAAFVMTSRAEACPNTVLEAMSQGALSVSCDNPPMPEFYGDAAVYYETGNGAALAAAITTALSMDTASQSRMRESARARAADFTWARTTRDTIRALQGVAARGERRQG